MLYLPLPPTSHFLLTLSLNKYAYNASFYLYTLACTLSNRDVYINSRTLSILHLCTHAQMHPYVNFLAVIVSPPARFPFTTHFLFTLSVNTYERILLYIDTRTHKCILTCICKLTYNVIFTSMSLSHYKLFPHLLALQGAGLKYFYDMEKNWGYAGGKVNWQMLVCMCLYTYICACVCVRVSVRVYGIHQCVSSHNILLPLNSYPVVYFSLTQADTADQDQDKTRTYDYCRVEYSHLDVILYAGEFMCVKERVEMLVKCRSSEWVN